MSPSVQNARSDDTPDEHAQIDTQTLRDDLLKFAGEITAGLPALRRADVFAHWTNATVEFIEETMPLIIESCVDRVEGIEARDDENAAIVNERLYAFGASRALTGVSSEEFLRVSSRTRRVMLRLFVDRASRYLDADTRLQLLDPITEVLDETMNAAMLGFSRQMLSSTVEDDRASGQLLRTVHAGIALGAADDTVAYVNDAFSSWFRNPAHETIGNKWADAFVIDGLGELLDSCDDCGEVWREVAAVDELGTQRLLRLSLRRQDGRLQAVAIDVSHQIEYEQMRREFVRGLIHDIRSPLTLVSGWANTLIQSTDKLDDDTRTTALESIVKAAQQVRDLTDRVLEIELLEGDAHSLEPITFDAAARIDEIVAKAGPVEACVATGSASEVFCDIDAFDRVLTNLIMNAFTHGRPPVTVTVAQERPGSLRGDIRIDVADSGSADPECIEDAFDGRVKSRTGFGIGLRVTRLLAEAMGGQISLSHPAPTTFSVWLPAARDV